MINGSQAGFEIFFKSRLVVPTRFSKVFCYEIFLEKIRANWTAFTQKRYFWHNKLQTTFFGDQDGFSVCYNFFFTFLKKLIFWGLQQHAFQQGVFQNSFFKKWNTKTSQKYKSKKISKKFSFLKKKLVSVSAGFGNFWAHFWSKIAKKIDPFPAWIVNMTIFCLKKNKFFFIFSAWIVNLHEFDSKIS